MAIARGEITITELYDGDNFYRAWADTPDGSGSSFTTEESDRAYLGVYSGREEPTHYSQYKWSRIRGESAITAILSNDSHQIGTDENGDKGNYTGAKTTVAVFHGGEDDTSNWKIDSIQIEPEGAVTGEVIDTYTYKVEDLKTDEASVIFRLTHKNDEYSPLEKTFTLSKNKQGISGQHATSYFLSFNDTAVKKFRETGTMEPAQLMMQGMSIKADQKPVPQSGYFKIYEQSEIALDRDQYEQAYVDNKLDENELYVISEKNYPLVLTYTSKEPEERLTYEYTDLIDIMSIKVYWYRDADFEELIDVQTISITSDGEKGDPGENAPLIKLSGDTQVVKISEDGVKTPNSNFTITGKSLNADIEKWEYAVNGGSFSTNPPVGVARSNNTVTINPGTINFNTLSIQATGAGVSDTFTVAQMADGLNAYTVLLSNESHTFQADTEKAVASSATTNILAYRGTKRMPVSVESVTGLPSGMTHTVSNNGEDNASITFNATTSLTSPSGLVSINLIIDGQQITKEFSYALSFKGDAGKDGTDAKLLYLTSTLETMSFDADGTATPSSQTATIEAKLQNTSGSISFSAKAYNGTSALSNSIALGGSGNSRTFSVSSFPSNATHVSITATLGNLTDTVSIFKLLHGKEGVGGAPGQNAIVGYLTNESITLGADSSGLVGSFAPATGIFKMFDGTTEVTTSASTTYALESSNGLTASINSSTGVYSITAMSADTATAEFKATYKGVSIFKTVTLSKSIAGEKGEPGDKGDSAISAVLTNESITFAADKEGIVQNYVGNTGSFLLMEGTVNKSTETKFEKVSETDVSATINSNGSYTISSMINGTSVTTGQVTFRATYKGTTIDKTVTISKSIAGQTGGKGDPGAPGGKGDPGAPATSYWLTSSVDTITVKYNGDYDPKTITYYGHSKTGSNNTQNYSGRFIVQTSIDGVSFTEAYRSPVNMDKVDFSVPEDILFIKSKFYQAGGTTYLLDEQTTPILHSADGLKGVGLEDKDYQVGTEIFTDKADDSVVHVEMDGKSYQHAGSGKNLFNKNKIDEYSTGEVREIITVENRQVIELSGTRIDVDNLHIYEDYKENTQYTARARIKNNSNHGNGSIRAEYTDGTTDGGSRITDWSYSYFTTDPNKTVSKFYFSNGANGTQNTFYLDINSIQIEEGSTATPYEPPAPTPDYPIEIHSLNDFDVVSQKSEGGMIDEIEVGGRNLVLDSTNGGSGWTSTAYNVIPRGQLSEDWVVGETYTVSIKGTVNSPNRFGIWRDRGSVGLGNLMNYNPLTGVHTQTYINIRDTTRNLKDVFSIYNVPSGSASQAKIEWIKIEKGNKATDWTPAPEDITESDNHPLIDKINLSLSEPLRSVGNVKDRLFRDSDGLWKIERNVGEHIEDGSANWRISLGGRFDSNSALSNSISSSHNNYLVSSTHYMYHGNTSGRINATWAVGNQLRVVPPNESVTGEDIKYFMKKEYDNGNPVIWLYPIRPITEILDQKLQDKLNNLRSFQDSNYVYTVLDKTDIIVEGLKPTLHATFKGGGYYARWKTAYDLEKTTEYIEQEIKRTQNTAWIRAGMRIGYSSFTQTNPNSVYICGLEYRDGYRDMVLVDKPAEIYVRDSEQTDVIPNQALSASGIPAGTTAYIIWDNTKKELFFIYYESVMTSTGVLRKRWRNISGQTIEFTDSLFAIGEVET